MVWRAVRYPDGDLAWASPSPSTSTPSEVVVWELPPGAVTACGWHHDIPSGTWVHKGSGLTSAHPPPRVFQWCCTDDNGSNSSSGSGGGSPEGGGGSGGGVVQRPSRGGYWHCKDTRESLDTLPSDGGPCETVCGWVAMGGRRRVWKHLPTGVESKEVPAPRGALLPAGTAATPSSPLTIPEHQWERVVEDKDGEQYWHCPSTGESLYELPKGAGTACGWVHDDGGDGGVWVHVESGVRSRLPPSLNAREAEAYILSHFTEHVKGAWRAPFGGEGGAAR